MGKTKAKIDSIQNRLRTLTSDIKQLIHKDTPDAAAKMLEAFEEQADLQDKLVQIRRWDNLTKRTTLLKVEQRTARREEHRRRQEKSAERQREVRSVLILQHSLV